ncbi:MAG: M2 family metallopeptidase [Polyangiaceae bacterium]
MFEGLDLPPDVARQLYLLKFSAELPAPDDEAKRKEFAGIVTKLDSIYGKGEYCSKKLVGHALPKGKDKKTDDGCRSLEELSQIIAESRDYDLLLEAWKGWRTISKPMRPMYQRFVELGNEGAKEIGFSDMGAIWKGHYDMSDADFVAEMDRLYVQVKPLYEQLHCYVRGKLSEKYGKDKVSPTGGIPAHLLGNMWAQEWEALYKDVEPYPGKGQPDLTAAMEEAEVRPHQDGQAGRRLLHQPRHEAAASDLLGAQPVSLSPRIATSCATPAPGTWA